MRRTSAIVLISMFVIMGTLLVATDVYGYSKMAHRYIVGKALEFHAAYGGSPQPSVFWEPLADGAYNEDVGGAYGEDHIFNYAEPICTYPHFWDVDDDNGYAYYGLDGLVEVGGLDWPNAWMKASGYRVSQFGNPPRMPEGQGLWQEAINFYRVGNYWEAYERLGHVCHLLADMSVPAHVHEDLHPSSDVYEDTISDNIQVVLAFLDPAELGKGLVDIPPDNSGLFPSTWPLFYLMYTTNQRADFFASEDDRGDGVDWLGLVDPNYSKWDPLYGGFYQYPSFVETPVWNCPVCGALQCVQGYCDDLYCKKCKEKDPPESNLLRSDHPQWVIAERVTLVYAVRATATLIREFLKVADTKPRVTSIAIGRDRYIMPDGQVRVSANTTVALTGTDTGSGVQATAYRVTGGGHDSGWTPYSAPFKLGPLADGPYTITYRSADHAGKMEADKSQVVFLTSQAADYRVSLSTGGSYLGIQAAIDTATNGSTITVKPGTFRECIDFKGKAITLRSVGGPEATTINGTGGLHVVSFVNAEGPGSVLDGFTITGGTASGVGILGGYGGGILCSIAQPVIRNCITTGDAALYGGGVCFLNMYPVLQNCLIHGNLAYAGGGVLSFHAQPTIANCTFSANAATGGAGGAIASFADAVGDTPILTNCILWGDSPTEIAYDPFPPFIFYCDMQNLPWPWYPGNRTDDPKFVDAAGGNFRLRADSPCIGVGDNSVVSAGQKDLDGYPRRLDGRCAGGAAVVDLGAYEFNYACKGDLNYDCNVDFADLTRLVEVWLDEPANRAIDIAPPPAGDGAVNLLDFAILADRWMEAIP